MKRRVTIKQVAEHVGLHYSTVSLALRGDLRIQPATRAKVQAAARELGYSPDALLTALSAYRRSSQPHALRSALVYLHDEKLDAMEIGRRELLDSARQRALELGYRLDTLRTQTSAITPARIVSIIEARGIKGILLGPHATPLEELVISAPNCSLVAIGLTITRPNYHRATFNQFQNMIMHLKALRSRGYRRIGLHLPTEIDLRTNGVMLGAYLSFQRHLPADDAVETVYHETDNKLPLVRRWIEEARLDAVISHEYYLPYYIRLGIDIPARLGFSSLSLGLDNVPPELGGGEFRPNCAGLDEGTRQLGRVAVDFLVSLMHGNQRGVSESPHVYVINGVFRPGPTILEHRE